MYAVEGCLLTHWELQSSRSTRAPYYGELVITMHKRNPQKVDSEPVGLAVE